MLIHSEVGFTAGLVMCDVEEHWSHTSKIIFMHTIAIANVSLSIQVLKINYNL